MKKITWILIAILQLACSAERESPVTVETQFKTSDASEIFFKNVRQRYYDSHEIEPSKMKVFRISERNIDADYPNLILAIVMNWRYDEAYVQIEANDLLPEKEIKIKWEDNNDRTSGFYLFNYGDKLEHLQFASEIYNSIISGHQLQLVRENEAIDFLFSKKDREAFRKTLKDYYRLIDLM